jgi:hypothetical protein
MPKEVTGGGIVHHEPGKSGSLRFMFPGIESTVPGGIAETKHRNP